MRTSLSLLTTDGAVRMEFQPALSPAQYARLLDISHRAATDQELREAVTAFARVERLRLTLDEQPIDIEWDS